MVFESKILFKAYKCVFANIYICFYWGTQIVSSFVSDKCNKEIAISMTRTSFKPCHCNLFVETEFRGKYYLSKTKWFIVLRERMKAIYLSNAQGSIGLLGINYGSQSQSEQNIPQ